MESLIERVKKKNPYLNLQNEINKEPDEKKEGKKKEFEEKLLKKVDDELRDQSLRDLEDLTSEDKDRWQRRHEDKCQ